MKYPIKVVMSKGSFSHYRFRKGTVAPWRHALLGAVRQKGDVYLVFELWGYVKKLNSETCPCEVKYSCIICSYHV